VNQTLPNKKTHSGRSTVHSQSESTDSEVDNTSKRTPNKKKRVAKSPVKLTTRAELMTKLDI